MNDSGHVILHRKILGWKWYLDVNICRLFIHMLLKANWKDSGWRKPQNGSTFFNSDYVDYLDANYKEQEAGETVGADNKSRGSAADFYEQFLRTGNGD